MEPTTIYVYMKQMDPHTLFSIFEAGDEEIYKENNVEELLENPYVLMGMVLRGVENWYIMDQMYTRTYPEQYKNVRSTIKYKFYNKLFNYLNRIPDNKFETVYKIGESFDSKEIMRGLNDMLYYYQDLEEYEKCGIIKNYIDLLSHDLISKNLLKGTGIVVG